MNVIHKFWFNYHKKRARTCPRNKHFYKMRRHQLKMVLCEMKEGW